MPEPDVLLPRLEADDREQFDLAVSSFLKRDAAAGTLVAFLRHPRGVLPPPWVFARHVVPGELAETTDPTIVGYFVAVDIRNEEPWLIRAYVRATAAGLVLGRVSVEHFDDPLKDVTRGVLRDVALGTIRDRALSMLRDAPVYVRAKKILGWTPETGEEERAAHVADAAHRPRRRGGRKSFGADYYRWLAGQYLELLELGRANLYIELARRVRKRRGQSHTPTRDTVRSQLQTAAGLGYLTGGVKGRPYQPGPNLYERKEDE